MAIVLIGIVTGIPVVSLAQANPITATIQLPGSNDRTVEVNTSVRFQGAVSGGLTPYTYNWTFGDGTPAQNSIEVTHTYSEVGTYNVTFRALDSSVAGNSDTETIAINVVASSAECNPLITETTSNRPEAIEVTKTSAVIVWETCEPATSRVVYGTASISTADLNDSNTLGYNSSTALDEAKVTSHRVELTGLTPNTQYFFRVLSAR